MRRMDHWTSRYIVDRVIVALHERLHPDDPWFTADAVRVLQTLVKPTDKCLEFGSGRSTRWFAERTHYIVSVEHDHAWHQTGLEQNSRFKNIDLRLVPSTDQNSAIYTGVLTEFPDETIDVVINDGLFRDACAFYALPKLRRSGLLIIDDVHRYLPSDSRSPDARSWEEGPSHQGHWAEVAGLLRGWRVIWTTSGVKDTAIFIKP